LVFREHATQVVIFGSVRDRRRCTSDAVSRLLWADEIAQTFRYDARLPRSESSWGRHPNYVFAPEEIQKMPSDRMGRARKFSCAFARPFGFATSGSCYPSFQTVRLVHAPEEGQSAMASQGVEVYTHEDSGT